MGEVVNEMVVEVALPGGEITEPVTLFCLPHAGGNASAFHHWPAAMGSAVQVVAIDYPGRPGASDRLPLTDWTGLLKVVMERILPLLRPARPFAFFGHSMGALLAIELAHAFRDKGLAEPIWLGVSGAVAPGKRPSAPSHDHWLRRDRGTMVDALRKLGGTPEPLLNDSEFIDFLMPMLQADFHLCGMHAARWRAGADIRRELTCPIDLLWGIDDPATKVASERQAWASETKGRFREHRFEGGHFYLAKASTSFWTAVSASLRDALHNVHRDSMAQ